MIWDLGFGIWDLGLGTWDLGLGTWDSGSGMWEATTCEFKFLKSNLAYLIRFELYRTCTF
ncbi:hypothetical protein SAMN05421636_11233 [Pricia antarctica]|uniref:Uncharacterized protein n=1 Tax=Pricia antarctica TaxID=641691 RepID=A0A1G7IHX4_9FLAO|nr:hypothetical protein SAMN05421636_11233 [Pricia antarctica]